MKNGSKYPQFFILIFAAVTVFLMCYSVTINNYQKSGLGSKISVHPFNFPEPASTAVNHIVSVPTNNDKLTILDFDRIFNPSFEYIVDTENDNGIDKESIQRRRINQLRQFCQNWRFTYKKSKARSLTLFTGHKCYECRVPKTGSSTRGAITWPIFHPKEQMKFESWSDWNHPMNDKKTRKVSMVNWKQMFKESFPYGYMFVRDPFQRALSAYFNKVLPHNLLDGGNWTLTEYIQHLIKDNIKDHHFRSQVMICDPCFLHIDYIGRTESMLDEFEIVVMNKTTLHNSIDFYRSVKNREKAKLNKSLIGFKEKNLNELSRDLIRQFIWKYRLDYVAFGYNPNILLSKLI